MEKVLERCERCHQAKWRGNICRHNFRVPLVKAAQELQFDMRLNAENNCVVCEQKFSSFSFRKTCDSICYSRLQSRNYYSKSDDSAKALSSAFDMSKSKQKVTLRLKELS